MGNEDPACPASLSCVIWGWALDTCGWLNNGSPDRVLVSCKCYVIWKKDHWELIKLEILRGGGYPGLPE